MVSFNQHNISDVAVVSSVIVNGSLDQALRGTLFNCGMNYSKLVYHAQYKRLENSTLSKETQVSLSKLRCTVHKQKFNDTHTELENNANPKGPVDASFKKLDGVP